MNGRWEKASVETNSIETVENRQQESERRTTTGLPQQIGLDWKPEKRDVTSGVRQPPIMMEPRKHVECNGAELVEFVKEITGQEGTEGNIFKYLKDAWAEHPPFVVVEDKYPPIITVDRHPIFLTPENIQMITGYIKKMYSGDSGEGKKTLSLQEIHDWKVNPDYKEQNIKQHAGFSAEVISTAKENMQAEVDGTGITTYRADERPDLYPKNDQYVDKVRVNSKGEVVERIQTKFVGDTPEQCLSKLASKKYGKYFNDGKVDKIEIPKDYFDYLKRNQTIETKIGSLKAQLERVLKDGKQDIAQKIQEKIDRYSKINEMLERSTVTSEEAIFATKYPKRYAAKMLAKDFAKTGHDAGKRQGAIAAATTAGLSIVDNTTKVIRGEKNAKEAIKDVAEDTAKSGVIGYGTGWVNGPVSRIMAQSSHKFIRNMGRWGVPSVVISVGIDSFDSVMDYARGDIDGRELTYNVGEKTVGILGSVAASAWTGALLGSAVPGAGNVVGTVVGMAAGAVGYTAAAAGYKTALAQGDDEGARHWLNEARNKASEMIESAKNAIPANVDKVKGAINHFASQNNVPLHVHRS